MLASCSDDKTVRIWGPGSSHSGYTRIHSTARGPARKDMQIASDDSHAGPTLFPWAMSPAGSGIGSVGSPDVQGGHSSGDEEEDREDEDEEDEDGEEEEDDMELAL